MPKYSRDPADPNRIIELPSDPQPYDIEELALCRQRYNETRDTLVQFSPDVVGRLLATIDARDELLVIEKEVNAAHYRRHMHDGEELAKFADTAQEYANEIVKLREIIEESGLDANELLAAHDIAHDV